MGGFIGFGKQHHAETHYGSETSKDTKEHEGRTVILRPGFRRRISGDASDSHAVSRLFGEDSREEPRQDVAGRNIPGRSVRPTEGLRCDESRRASQRVHSCSKHRTLKEARN